MPVILLLFQDWYKQPANCKLWVPLSLSQKVGKKSFAVPLSIPLLHSEIPFIIQLNNGQMRSPNKSIRREICKKIFYLKCLLILTFLILSARQCLYSPFLLILLQYLFSFTNILNAILIASSVISFWLWIFDTISDARIREPKLLAHKLE